MFHQKDFRKRTLQEILTDGNSLCAEVNAQLRPLPLFAEYLRYGYYPFLKEGQNNYYLRIENIVNTIIEVELPQLRKLDVGKGEVAIGHPFIWCSLYGGYCKAVINGGDVAQHIIAVSAEPQRGTADSIALFRCYQRKTSAETGQNLSGEHQHAACPRDHTGE